MARQAVKVSKGDPKFHDKGVNPDGSEHHGLFGIHEDHKADPEISKLFADGSIYRPEGNVKAAIRLWDEKPPTDRRHGLLEFLRHALDLSA